MKRKIVWIVVVAVIAIVLYYSAEVVPIEEAEKGFDPNKYARTVWNKLLANLDSLDPADASDVLNSLDENLEKAHSKFARIVGVSNYRYYIVKGTGEVLSMENDAFTLKVRDSASDGDFLITTHIFGNSVVNATGIIKMEDFERINDFNLVAGSLNRIISEEVVASFLNQLKERGGVKGSMVNFIGVFTLLKDEEIRYPLKLVPLHLELVRGGF